MPFITSVNCLNDRCGLSFDVAIEKSDSYFLFQCPLCQKRYLLWSQDLREVEVVPPDTIVGRLWEEPSSCPLPEPKPPRDKTPPRGIDPIPRPSTE